MPSGFETNLSLQDAVNLLAHAQTLPTKPAAAAPAPAPAQPAAQPTPAAVAPAQPTPPLAAATQLPRTGEPGLPVLPFAAIGALLVAVGWATWRLRQGGLRSPSE